MICQSATTSDSHAAWEAMAARLADKDRELEAYRAALKGKENVLAMSEVERKKREGYRNDLSDQLNEAEEQWRGLKPGQYRGPRP